MNVKTAGRKVSLKQNFVTTVEKRLDKFDRYFDKDAEATVTVTVENNRQTVEITVRSRGFIYRAERTAFDMEQAFAEAADVIEKQIVKNKDKLGARIKKQDQSAEMPPLFSADDIVDEEYRIVREKRFTVKPMSVEEAVLQMNMLGHSFFVFLSDESGDVCVVYRRRDDDYGLLIPEKA